MGFWMARTFSWALLCLLLGPLRSASSAEEPHAPWLLQPLQPPSPLRLSQLKLSLDYTRRERPEWLWMRFQTRLRNDSADSVQQQLMFVTADSDASIRFDAKPLVAEKLVMPLSLSRDTEANPPYTRVSVVKLILLGGEEATLEFEGYQRLEFSTLERHRVRFLLPLHRAWKSVEDTQVELRLAPELTLLNASGWVRKNQSFERVRGKYATGPLEMELAAPVEARQSLGSQVGAVPALRRHWLWSLAAVLLALLPGLWRRWAWWLAPPLAWAFYTALTRGMDPVCEQWTFYRGARAWEATLDAYRWYGVPGLALLGALSGWRLSRPTRKEEH